MKKRHFLYFFMISSVLLSTWVFLQFPDLFFTYPNAIPAGFGGPHLFDTFFGGDHIQLFFLGWKLKENLLHLQNPFLDPFTFASNNLVNTDFHIGIQFQLIALLISIFGDSLGYNLAVTLVPILLTALACWYMLSAITNNPWFVALGSLYFSIIPQRIIQMINGHSGGIVYLLLPLYFGAFIRAERASNPRLPSIFSGLILFLTLISDEHQGFYLFLATPILMIAWYVQDCLKVEPTLTNFLNQMKKNLFHWRYFLLSLFFVFSYAYILNNFVLTGKSHPQNAKKDVYEIMAYSLPLFHFFKSYGADNIGEIFFRGGSLCSFLFLVYQLVIHRFQLPFSSFASFLKNPLFLHRGFAFVFVLIFSCLCLVGIGQDWSQLTHAYKFFYLYIPFFSYQRVPGKIFGVVAISFLILMAYLFQKISDSKTKPLLLKSLKTLLLLLLLAQIGQFVKFFNKSDWHHFVMSSLKVGPQNIFDRFKDDKDRSLVLYLPVLEGLEREDTMNLYLAYASKIRLIGGYNGSRPENFLNNFQDLQTITSGHPNKAALAYLSREKVRYLLLEERLIPNHEGDKSTQALVSHPMFRLDSCESGFCLFSITNHL